MWRPSLLEKAEAYAAELDKGRRASRTCTAERHVVFDLHDESGDEETFDELETDDKGERFLVGSALRAGASAPGAGGPSHIDGALYDFLQAVGLASLGSVIGKTGMTLEQCATASTADRTAFLAQLRDAGVTKLTDRQSFANAIGKATREGWLRPPYKGPFTAAGRELRQMREAQPNVPAPKPNTPSAYGSYAYSARPMTSSLHGRTPGW